MNSNEIVIKIDHSISGDSSGAETVDAEQNGAITKEKSNGNSVSKTIAVYMAKQAVGYAFSNYGNLTGDYIAQANIQGTIEVAGLIALAVSSPVGAVSAGMSLAVKIANMSIENYKKNISINQLRERTGMIGYSGGRA
jgi:hypothetical protein